MKDITIDTLSNSYKAAIKRMQEPYKKVLDISPDRILPPTPYKGPPPPIPSMSFYIHNDTPRRG